MATTQRSTPTRTRPTPSCTWLRRSVFFLSSHALDETHTFLLPRRSSASLLLPDEQHHMDSFDIQAFFHLHDLNRCVPLTLYSHLRRFR
jgi:hypothetical protein